MKSKSIIGAALAAIFTVGLTTSCEDMFDIKSSRVIYEENHELGSTADSVYTTTGILQSVRKIADRYIILGEVRGDLVDVNDLTKTSLRNLSEFNFEDENEYLNIRDYYAVINNCNYALAKMDTTLATNNERVMTDEYAAILGIRAWTYMQMAINYGKVPYYTEPITTVADSEKEYPMLDIKGLAAELIPQLEAFKDYQLPVFTTYAERDYPVLQLVLADLYLWSGDYANAAIEYEDYLSTHKAFNYTYGDESTQTFFKGYMGFDGGAVTPVLGTGISANLTATTAAWDDYLWVDAKKGAYENLAFITMERTSANGLVSEVGGLFFSLDNTHPLNPSAYWKEISTSQSYIKATLDKENKKGKDYSVNAMAGGDQRRKLYTNTMSNEGKSFDVFTKFTRQDVSTGETELYTPHINIYRRAIVYLRCAEAYNAFAKQLYNAGFRNEADTIATASFNLLKDAYQVFFPEGHVLEEELKEAFIGVHARGCGDINIDTTHYVLKPNVIAKRLYDDPEMAVNFNDTIDYIDELIIDELAMEAALEGNRFGDLIRFAERRGEPEFLAKRVASRKGKDHMNDDLFNKLMDKENWYLPIK